MHGGAGKKEDILLLLENNNVNALSAASIFHYNFIQEEGYNFRTSNEGNTDFLSNVNINKNLVPINISELKLYLKKNNIDVRM